MIITTTVFEGATCPKGQIQEKQDRDEVVEKTSIAIHQTRKFSKRMTYMARGDGDKIDRRTLHHKNSLQFQPKSIKTAYNTTTITATSKVRSCEPSKITQFFRPYQACGRAGRRRFLYKKTQYSIYCMGPFFALFKGAITARFAVLGLRFAGKDQGVKDEGVGFCSRFPIWIFHTKSPRQENPAGGFLCRLGFSLSSGQR